MAEAVACHCRGCARQHQRCHDMTSASVQALLDPARLADSADTVRPAFLVIDAAGVMDPVKRASMRGSIPITTVVAHLLQAGVDVLHQLAIGGNQVTDQPHHIQQHAERDAQ